MNLPECTLSKDTLSIKKATGEDVGLIHLLIKELAAFEGLSHAVSARVEDIYFALFGQSPVLNAFVARVGNSVVGFASYYWTYSTFRGAKGLYIEDLFVRPSSRRQGTGRALMASLAAEAVKQGCDRMAWSVLAWNEDALRFYRSLGAAPVTEWLGYGLADEALTHLAGGGRPEFTPAGE
jgi:GNAT superfamily N-acetyltransferase